ncbi:aldehyde dehydrogenase family protein, partial [Burkholderia sola]|uniref:aldehyde dehydrogenase family protein n=1 Tax=Burkholderia sola TaxID=2843302 RepID=UPI00338D45DE
MNTANTSFASIVHYVNGQRTAGASGREQDVTNPATGQVTGRVALASRADVDAAVAAARRAFDGFSQTTRDERLALLDKVLAVYMRRI